MSFAPERVWTLPEPKPEALPGLLEDEVAGIVGGLPGVPTDGKAANISAAPAVAAAATGDNAGPAAMPAIAEASLSSSGGRHRALLCKEDASAPRTALEASSIACFFF